MDWQTAVGFCAVTLLIPGALSWAATFWIRRRAAAWGLVDQPGARKVHATPTPLGGGLAIWAAVVGCLGGGLAAAWFCRLAPGLTAYLPPLARAHLAGVQEQTGELLVLLVAATLLMLLGLGDDRRGIDWRIRISVQLAVALGVVFWRGWELTAFIPAPWLTVTLSAIWIVALVNAFNMLDNMDGLSAGVAAIAALMLAAFLLFSGTLQGGQPQLFVGGFLLVLAGALLGFLWHNRPPARIFMGDAGSYFVGFCMAVATLLATYTSYAGAARHTILAPLCVMAVPLYDMTTVIWIRLREGRSPFEGDKNHFSHRLVELGLTKGQAVATIYLTTATCGLGALLLPQVDSFGAGVVLLMILSVLTLIHILESTARRKLDS